MLQGYGYREHNAVKTTWQNLVKKKNGKIEFETNDTLACIYILCDEHLYFIQCW